ncbi:MAG TPA: CoA transferase, partial [Turneriella sp.]|nr:CoA transferase [Turneriella sp.]
DILLEGFRPDTLNDLGIGYEQLKEKFPRLIYCAISGYGATGVYKEHAGHDANYIARSGLLALNGVKDGAPVVPGFQVADIGGGTLTALSSILAALYAREKTGRGQFIDISMQDGAAQFLSLYMGEFVA